MGRRAAESVETGLYTDTPGDCCTSWHKYLSTSAFHLDDSNVQISKLEQA